MCYKRKSLPIQKCQKTRKHYRKECKWCVDCGKVAWSGHGRLCLCLAPHCVSCCDDCCWSLSWLPLSPAFHYRHTFSCAATVRHSLGRAVCRVLKNCQEVLCMIKKGATAMPLFYFSADCQRGKFVDVNVAVTFANLLLLLLFYYTLFSIIYTKRLLLLFNLLLLCFFINVLL